MLTSSTGGFNAPNHFGPGAFFGGGGGGGGGDGNMGGGMGGMGANAGAGGGGGNWGNPHGNKRTRQE